MKTIVFCNKKGGVGKTTSALCFAAYLSILGKKVIGIDMDSQANFTMSSGGEDNVQGVLEFLKNAPLEDVFQNNGTYDFIGADNRLSNVEGRLDSPIGKEFLLKRSLPRLSDIYDYCIVDTPSSMSLMTLNSLIAADELIICCQAEAFSAHAFDEIISNIKLIKENYNPNLQIAGILITLFDGRSNITKEMYKFFQDTADDMGIKIFSSTIRINAKLREAQNKHKDIFTLFPKSNGAVDYISVINEYLGGENNG